MLVSQGLLWAAVIILALAVAALARQLGVLHERIAPVGALVIGQGPTVGQIVPDASGLTLDAQAWRTREALVGKGLTLFLFVAPNCPICKVVLPTAKDLARIEALRLVLAGDGDFDDHRALAERFGIPRQSFVLGEEIGRAFHVGKLPHAVVIDNEGRVASQGLVNTREHLESLLVARETGFDTVQDYLSGRKPETGHAHRVRIDHD